MGVQYSWLTHQVPSRGTSQRGDTSAWRRCLTSPYRHFIAAKSRVGTVGPGEALYRDYSYSGSTEELTPVAGDPLAAVPVAAAALACLLRPSLERLFTSKAVSGYALTPQGWHDLQAA